MGLSINSEKNTLRKVGNAKRKAVQQRETKNIALEKNLATLEEVKNAKVIHCYISKDYEASTQMSLRRFLKDTKTVVVPSIQGKIMNGVILNSMENLHKGTFGILEPSPLINYGGDFDVVILPGIFFDTRGDRLGHGGGYYDGFLRRTSAVKIGLAYEQQIIDKVPVEDHDINMDYIITERRIIDCRKDL